MEHLESPDYFASILGTCLQHLTVSPGCTITVIPECTIGSSKCGNLIDLQAIKYQEDSTITDW